MEEPRPAAPPVPDPTVPDPPWRRRRFLRHAEHPLFHLGLLALTFATTTAAGGAFFGSGPTTLSGVLANGLRFSIPVLLILGTHEMGHYWMCRRYGLSATRPYFLPAPTLFGTFGALIRIKEPIRDKKVLLDVGAAGPLAGFAMCLPFLLLGIGRAAPVTTAVPHGTTLFEYPLLVRWAQDWTGLPRYTSATVHEDPMFMAAWFGLAITALNLLPIGQLDGGHILRAAIGRRQPLVSAVVLAVAIALVLRGGFAWSFFALFVTALMGLSHPPPDNDDEPLGTGRLTIALLCLAVFLLSASLTPISQT